MMMNWAKAVAGVPELAVEAVPPQTASVDSAAWRRRGATLVLVCRATAPAR